MKPEKIVSTKTSDWNSDEYAVRGLTCKQASTFLTGMISAYRAMISVATKDGDLGVGRMAIQVLKNTLDICDSPVATQEMREAAQKKLPLALMSIGQALMISTSVYDIGVHEMANLTGAALESLNKLFASEKEKSLQSFLEFAVRVKGVKPGTQPKLEIGVGMVDISALVKQATPQQNAVIDSIDISGNKSSTKPEDKFGDN